MIRNLSEEELEHASGGFDIERYIGLPNGRRVNLGASAVILSSATYAAQDAEASIPVGMAPPEPQPRLEALPTATPNMPDIKNLLSTTCRNRRGRYELCQEDGVYERWERYRPKQPAFRSRFINR